MGRVLACIIVAFQGGILVGACSRVFKTERKEPPNTWALKAAALHAMTTPPPAFLADKPDCEAAPMPDLQLFCEKKCDQIGELTLKAYCAWDCDAVKNPDVGVMCKLERRRDIVRVEECDPIYASDLKAHCKEWVASMQTQNEKDTAK